MFNVIWFREFCFVVDCHVVDCHVVDCHVVFRVRAVVQCSLM